MCLKLVVKGLINVPIKNWELFLGQPKHLFLHTGEVRRSILQAFQVNF